MPRTKFPRYTTEERVVNQFIEYFDCYELLGEARLVAFEKRLLKQGWKEDALKRVKLQAAKQCNWAKNYFLRQRLDTREDCEYHQTMSDLAQPRSRKIKKAEQNKMDVLGWMGDNDWRKTKKEGIYKTTIDGIEHKATMKKRVFKIEKKVERENALEANIGGAQVKLRWKWELVGSGSWNRIRVTKHGKLKGMKRRQS